MLSLRDVENAREHVSGVVHQTPLLHSNTFSRMFGCQVYLKAENLQRTGSFKLRGAVNRLRFLTPEQRSRGVIAASAGNHAQGVALAAQRAGIAATIVMPTTVSLPKLAATRGYGARVRLEGESFDEALAHATRLASEQGLTFIHAYDDPHIIAGQGTVGLELLAQLPDVDAIVVPVGGGGLLAGVATAVKTLRPSVKVFGVQAAAAPAVARSKAAGAKIVVPAATTVADGIAVATPGEAGLESIVRHVEDIALVDEEAITQAMVLLLERCKLVVEGAGAVTVAALLSERLKVPNGQVALLLSGGNVDANVLAQVIEHGLVHASRFLALRVTLLDRPGQLAALLECLAEAKSNVVEVSHHRRGPHLRLGQVAVEVSLEVRDPDHAREVIEHLERRGYTRQSLSAEFSVPGVHYFTVVQ